MEKFFNLFYNRFILRDILSIFSTGIIIVYLLYRILSPSTFFTEISSLFNSLWANDFIKILIILLSIAIIYAFGLLINFIRDFLYFLLFYADKKTRTCCIFTKHSLNIRKYYDMKIKISKTNLSKTEYYKPNNDRLVVIFQTLGNIGIAFILLSLAFFSHIEIVFIFLIGGIVFVLASIRVFIHHKVLNQVMEHNL